jgi:hypothetical protein
VPELENSTSGIPWSPTGYHSDRRAFYMVADTLRLYAKAPMVKVKPALSHRGLRRRTECGKPEAGAQTFAFS